MSKGIDYSKWDKITDSDDEDEHGGSPPALPYCRVNFSSSSAAQAITPGKNVGVRKQGEQNGRARKTKDERWTENGASHEFKGRQILWAQDRYHVWVRVELLPNDDAKQMQFQLRGKNISSYADRHASVATRTGCAVKVVITKASTSESKTASPPVLEGTLRYPIHLDEGDEDNRVQESVSLDWTVEYRDDDRNNEKKYAEFQLNKASPMEGLALWWHQLFQETEEIELPPASSATRRNGGRGATFQEAWDEAHKLFKEKMQQQKQQE